MAELPPEVLPALPDPAYGGELGPYANSALRDVCGTRINPDALPTYRRRQAALSADSVVMHCGHPLLEALLHNAKSFDPRMDVRQRARSEWPLSKIISQIQIWGDKLPYKLPENLTCIVNYEDLAVNPSTPPRNQRSLRIHDRFDDSNDLLLGFFGDHEYNAALWTQVDFWSEPFLDNFTGIIIPGFSAFSDDPIPQSLLGERQLQIFAEEGSLAGHNVIPMIAWRDEQSLRRQAELVRSSYPHVHTVMLDCYGMHVNAEAWAWRWLFGIAKYCQDLPIRWLVAGLTAGWMVEKLNEIFPNGNYHLIASAAMHRRAMAAAASPDIMSDRFMQSIKRLESYCSGEERVNSKDWPDEWPTFSRAQLPQST